MSETRPPVAQRNTRQKRAVKAALHEAADFVSAQALFELLEEQGEPIGLNTVYRVLSGMVETGDADTINTETETLFRACSTEHHHHLICRQCGKTVEIAAEPIEDWARGVAAEHGYTQAEHLIDIFALCAECSAKLK